VRADGVDPRDTRWEENDPAFRVYFWHRPPTPEGVPADHEVIAWAEARLPAGDQYVLYVEHADGGRRGLVRLAGHDPTQLDAGPPVVLEIGFELPE
jgi:hypothetical protein